MYVLKIQTLLQGLIYMNSNLNISPKKVCYLDIDLSLQALPHYKSQVWRLILHMFLSMSGMLFIWQKTARDTVR